MTDERKKIKQPFGESENLSPEQKIEFFQERTAVRPNKFEREEKKLTREEIITKEALKREIDKMELDDSLKKEADEKAKEIETLGEGEKIEHLLEDAKIKGVAFSVKVAERMNDSYILDTFHDILVKEWAYYKKFLK